MQRRIEFLNPQGERLVGVLHGKPTSAMVVMCHGMLSNKEGAKHMMLAAALQDYSIASLRFDFTGCGESTGTLWHLSYRQRIEDLQAALAYLTDLGVEHFGLFGSSLGGAIAYLVAAGNMRIRAVATWAAVGHPEHILKRHPKEVALWTTQGYIETPVGRIGPEFIKDALHYNVVAAASAVRAPVLVLHGDQDATVPWDDAHDIARAAQNASLELIEGAQHEISLAHLSPVVDRISRFLAEALCGVCQ